MLWLKNNKHIRRKILGCANIEIVHNLWVLAVFVGKELPIKNTIL